MSADRKRTESIETGDLKVITKDQYRKLSPAQQELSDSATLMARSHAIYGAVAHAIKVLNGEAPPTKTIKSSDLTPADRKAHRRFVEETGDYIT